MNLPEAAKLKPAQPDALPLQLRELSARSWRQSVAVGKAIAARLLEAMMPFEIVCHTCGCRLRVQDEHAGKLVRCPDCSTVVATEPSGGDRGEGNPVAARGPAQVGREVNPYASPQTTWEKASTGSEPGEEVQNVPGIGLALSQTRPWASFLAIVGFLSAGLLGLMAIVISIVFALPAQGGQPPGWFFGASYMILAVIYFGGARYLFAYGRGIGEFLRTGRVGDLEAALVAQKSFWKLVGMVTAVSLALMVLGVAVLLVAAMIFAVVG